MVRAVVGLVYLSICWGLTLATIHTFNTGNLFHAPSPSSYDADGTTPSTSRAAHVLNVAGSTEYLQPDSHAWRPVTPFEELPAGTALRTGPNSRIDLLLGDSVGVHLSENGEILLSAIHPPAWEGSREVHLTLNSGKIISVVDPNKPDRKYAVYTAQGIVTAKGTVFLVESSGRSTRAEVLRGVVEIRAAPSDAPPTGVDVESVLLWPGESAQITDRSLSKEEAQPSDPPEEVMIKKGFAKSRGDMKDVVALDLLGRHSELDALPDTDPGRPGDDAALKESDLESISALVEECRRSIATLRVSECLDGSVDPSFTVDGLTLPALRGLAARAEFTVSPPMVNLDQMQVLVSRDLATATFSLSLFTNRITDGSSVRIQRRVELDLARRDGHWAFTAARLN